MRCWWKKPEFILLTAREKDRLKSAVMVRYDAKDDMKNRMFMPLQEFRGKIRNEFSIPQISYYVKEAEETFDNEWIKIA